MTIYGIFALAISAFGILLIGVFIILSKLQIKLSGKYQTENPDGNCTIDTDEALFGSKEQDIGTSNWKKMCNCK